VFNKTKPTEVFGTFCERRESDRDDGDNGGKSFFRARRNFSFRFRFEITGIERTEIVKLTKIHARGRIDVVDASDGCRQTSLTKIVFS